MKPSNGISSTPVIDLGTPPDPSKGTLYVVAKLNQDEKFHIFALALSTLAIRPNAQGQSTGVVVSGAAAGQNKRGRTTIEFDSDHDHYNRPALLLSGNRLVVAFGSGPNNDGDGARFHGWVMSYSLPDLVQTGAFVTTPTTDTGMGGIWQSGNGPAADDQGNVYVMTGNGHFQSAHGLPDLADSFIKLENKDGTLQLADWYAPPSRDVMEACDLDLGASGPAVIQDSGKVIGAGKSGILYVLDKDGMGRTDTPFDLAAAGAWRGTPDCTVGQCFRVAENQHGQQSLKQACNMAGFPFPGNGWNTSNWNDVLNSYPHVHGSPVVWKLGRGNYNLYVWPEEDYLKAYHFDGQKFSPTPIGSSAPLSAAMMSMPGGILSLSWDGTKADTGVIWASRPDPRAPRGIVGGPVVSVFHDQQHFVFRDEDGAIWDSFYVRTDNSWHFQEINIEDDQGGVHPAAGDIAVSVFDAADQQHFAYPDSGGTIWDSFYERGNNTWHFQQIATHGHPAAGAIAVSAFHDQQHFAYRDKAGLIWDSFFVQSDGKWHFQEINTGGHPATAGNLSVSAFDAADQQHFAYPDGAGKIWDSFFERGNNTWHFQQIATHNHPAFGNIAVSAFHDQQHFAYRDRAGLIWDSFFVQSDGKWHFQEINTNGHPATAGDLFVSVFDAADQQHFAYPDGAGAIWNSFYERGNNTWHFQQIDTHGHPAVGDIFVSAFFDQQHFAYRDTPGRVFDAFYAQTGNRWRFQEINAYDCMGSSSDQLDLTPNGAPCNAINKIVHGYLQAFSATPGPNGRLKELWNSEKNPNDRVEWFSKESPPTVADGKVFVAEFPARPPGPNSDWNSRGAFGRLIVYARH